MKLKELFAIVEKARANVTDKELEQEVRLYVSGAKLQAKLQSGDYGDSTKLWFVEICGNTLTVGGG